MQQLQFVDKKFHGHIWLLLGVIGCLVYSWGYVHDNRLSTYCAWKKPGTKPCSQTLPTISVLHREGRPGPFYHMNDVSVYLSRQKGGEWAWGLILKFVPQALEFWMFRKRKISCSWFETKNSCMKCVLSVGDPPTFCLHTNVIHMIKWMRPSPSIFAYYKLSKTGLWKGLGTRLRLIHDHLWGGQAKVSQNTVLLYCWFDMWRLWEGLW